VCAREVGGGVRAVGVRRDEERGGSSVGCTGAGFYDDPTGRAHLAWGLDC